MNHLCDRIDIGYAVYDLNPDTGELEVYNCKKNSCFLNVKHSKILIY